LLEPFTVAANCCWFNVIGHELPASFANSVARPGFTVTVIGGGGGVVVELLLANPPQESSAITPSAKQAARRPIRSFFREQRFRPAPKIPATKTQPTVNNGRVFDSPLLSRGESSPKDSFWASVLLARDCVPKFGPVLEMERVTVLAADPAVIDAGLKTQLVKAGRLLHAKFTAEVKLTPPTGAAENV
jgi:hypothetical protein